MASPEFPHYYSPQEEIANSVTHGIGAVLSIAGLAVLVGFAVAFGDVWHIVGVSIYGASLITLYTASTLYHSVWHSSSKRIFRSFDHAAIFLLIAGTYTPFTLVNLRGPWGWTLLAIVWAIAVAGIVFKFAARRKFETICLFLYIAAGWVALICLPVLIHAVPPGGLALLLAGGLAYTLGTIFFVRTQMPYHHAVWHLFVLAGSLLHYFAVLFFVIPLAV